MALAVGTRLGPYEILSLLGAGGMGAVYRARDTRLQREVAIKVLPAQHTRVRSRRQRFLREAQAVSALAHPNIVTLHDVGESGGTCYLVMERVVGRTLEQAISRGGLRPSETLRLALQMADGLDKAHAAGILHRDLKPGNVMVTDDGVVKLLDFGLAKLVQPEKPPANEIDSTDTAAGAVLGTVAYMSPEQAQGLPLDARSDIFSFGSVLYEMATGTRAFQGKTPSAVLAAVVAQEPRPPHELVAEIPRDLERIIQRCLRKDPERRFQAVSDVKVELLELKEDSESARLPTGAGHGWRPTRRRLALVAIGLAAAAGAALLLRSRRTPAVPAPVVVQLSPERNALEGSFSPDASQIVFSTYGPPGLAACGIRLEIVGDPEVRSLTAGPWCDRWPAWSPDGTRIAFVRFPVPVEAEGRRLPRLADSRLPGSIYVVSPLGGAARRIADIAVRGPWWFGGQLSWSPDGLWLAAARAPAPAEAAPGSAGIHLVPIAGGASRATTFPREPGHDAFPAFSPDGRALVYASCAGAGEMAPCTLQVLPLDPDRRPAGPSRRLPGAPVRVWGLAWTRDGRSVVYGTYDESRLWRVPADGGRPPEPIALAGRGAASPSSAAGHDRLAYVRSTVEHDIYRVQPGAAPAPFLASSYEDSSADYSPDGRRIAFVSDRSGDAREIWLARADGSEPTRLTYGPGRWQGSPRWSPDGRAIAFDSAPEEGRAGIWTIDVDGADLRRVTHGPGNDGIPSWSRDGRFLYYGSERTGRWEAWRIPVAGGPEEQLTKQGGFAPVESADGRTLYYLRSIGAALIARSAGGGAERMVLPSVELYAVGPRGVFYVPGGGSGSYVVRHLDVATRQDRLIGTLDTVSHLGGLAVSPDGGSILFGRLAYASDLMMIDHFR
jgi:Tol biopolymer transport system component